MAGGGTGGHLYPGLAVAELLRARGDEVLFVGTRRGLGARVVPALGYPISFVRARGLAGGLPGKLRAVIEGAVGLVQSLALLARRRPDLVIGTGGYVCAPVVLAATVLGIPSVLMEQNALPGKATRFLGRFARRVCLSFPGSEGAFPEGRTELTGNPVRRDIVLRERRKARERLGLAEGRPCVLVSGASQGASSLNRAVLKALPAWRERDRTVLHLTGPTHLDEVQARSAPYREGARLDYRPLGYLEDMADAYAAADLVVCRAGATTLAEVTARGLPAVLVPYPYATERHQDHNARVLAEGGAAVVVADEVVEDRLGPLVDDLLDRHADLFRMAEASRALGQPRAAERVVEVALRVAGRSGRTGRISTTAGSRPRKAEERGRG